MINRDVDTKNERKTISYSKADVIKLDTKCLYAGKLERIKEWKENAHSHPFCEILFVLSGSGEATIEDITYPIKKGDIIVYNPNSVHKESTAGKGGLELAFFGIKNFKINDLPSDYLFGEGVSPVFATKGSSDKFEFYFKTLAQEVYEDKHYSELIAKYFARLIMIEILRLANISEAKFVTNAIFTSIYQYLNTHYLEIESMDQICNDLHISKYYLSHVFKNYMGKPPMQYVTSLRINYAKKLLQETDLPATEVGEMCGYSDHALFFKAFKKIEEMTPIAFRKQAQRPAGNLHQ